MWPNGRRAISNRPEEEILVDDVIVIVPHPYGVDSEVPLRQWMTSGPGPRDLIAPTAAKHTKTGAWLPLAVIPLQYRNDRESRRLIAEGKIEDPWKKR